MSDSDLEKSERTIMAKFDADQVISGTFAIFETSWSPTHLGLCFRPGPIQEGMEQVIPNLILVKTNRMVLCIKYQLLISQI